jgi:uncharacterized membrane protein
MPSFDKTLLSDRSNVGNFLLHVNYFPHNIALLLFGFALSTGLTKHIVGLLQKGRVKCLCLFSFTKVTIMIWKVE